MAKFFTGITIVVCLLVAGCNIGQKADSSLEATSRDLMLAHNVYFTLKDNSESAKENLIDACHKYLKKHPGVEFFAAGSLAEEYDRPVNDMDFDVGLHLVFKNKQFHDKYQTAQAHLQFIEEDKDNWQKVRVFDTFVK